MDQIDNKSRKGILQARLGEQMYELLRFKPAPGVDYFVENYWIIRWDLRGAPPYCQTVLTHPNVNLAFEQNHSRIYGVTRTTFSHLLEGSGTVVGVKFKPGGFYPFYREPVSKLTDAAICISELFGSGSLKQMGSVLEQETPEKAALLVEAFLADRLPERDPAVELVSGIVSCIQKNRTITKVDDLVSTVDFNKRAIQRLFHRYVGVSPKWVIARYRLHEAAERIEQGSVRDWMDLCWELGYYDQAHFIKDFKAMVGRSPEDYVCQSG